MPLSEIQSYSTSSSLSRRQFLKFLTTLCGLALLPSGGNGAAAPMLPVWWVALHNDHEGKVHGPGLNQPPYGLPGSLMKLVAATALLEERLLSTDTAFECRGTLEIRGEEYHCQHPHGKLTLQEAIGVSCNLFFAQATQPLSGRRFLQYAEQFQLNQPVTFNQPVMFGQPALEGLYSSQKLNIQQTQPASDFRQKALVLGHHVHSFLFPAKTEGRSQTLALGLNPALQPNALQLLSMTCLIAERRVPGIQPVTWDVLQGGMSIAATRGTASALDPAQRFRLALKTGTAPHGRSYQSWLLGYFPFDNPQYAFCVRSAAGTAKDSAVPLARRFLQGQAWRFL